MLAFQQTDETGFVFDDAPERHHVLRPVEVPVGERQHDPDVNVIVFAHAFVVHGQKHSRFASNSLIDGAVVVRGAVLPMLNEFFFSVDFKRPGPVFLLHDQQGVSANDDQIDFALSTLLNVRYANRFKHVPAVGFPCGSTDFCQPLFGQLSGPVDFIGGVKTSTLSPPIPPLAEFHVFTEEVRPRC